ncbi:UTP--glucose-1-phosphate uridylyltransferase [Primorskyibacter sp. S187A]|uniref:UTP--glucose-1-phosphate uridylyltransferase n=1 Tax=Primorskyibacter sp. S187A TaxID=3415130 RepID=UPI003C7A735B
MTKVRKAVFPVAGLGTRFLPATKSIPKEMLPLVDRPLIQYAVDEARAAGIEEFLFITSPGKAALESYFGAVPLLEHQLAQAGKASALETLAMARLPEGCASFIRQDSPLGLGHAIALAERWVGDDAFAVILPDDVVLSETPALAQMVEAHRRLGCHMVATEHVPADRISAYGVVDIEQAYGSVQRVRGLVEKPAAHEAPSAFGIVGRYILQPSVFAHLRKGTRGSGGEIQLTDAIAADLAQTGVAGFAFEGTRYDCGSVPGFVDATVAFAQARADIAPKLAQAAKDHVYKAA